MANNLPSQSHVSDDFVIDVVEALEASALDRDQYCLSHHLDVEALERLVKSCEDVTVHVTVETTTLEITDDDVKLVESQ